jgi:hypothetical protein
MSDSSLLIDHVRDYLGAQDEFTADGFNPGLIYREYLPLVKEPKFPCITLVYEEEEEETFASISKGMLYIGIHSQGTHGFNDIQTTMFWVSAALHKYMITTTQVTVYKCHKKGTPPSPTWDDTPKAWGATLAFEVAFGTGSVNGVDWHAAPAGPFFPAGPQGIQGDPGPQGTQGETGLQGDPGPQGIQGIQGVQGNPGATLRSGSGVPSDSLGNDGDYYINTVNDDLYTKVSGTWGSPIANIKGATGPQGEQGIQGIQGVQGDPGPQGIQGIQGVQGNPGATLRSGSGVPSDSLGNDGDYYINTVNDDLYTKVSGTWGSPIANIKGATGPQGEQGIQGIQGVQGDPGPNQVTTSTATDITGLLKGNGSLVSAATAGVDYAAANHSHGDPVLANGSNPTVDAAGEVAVDTTNDQLLFFGSALKVLYPKITRTVVIYSDGDWTSEEIPIMDFPDVPCTITAIRASVLGTGTPTIAFNLEERPWGTDITTAGTNITSSAMTADADGLEQTSFSNAGMAAKAHLVLTTAGSGVVGGTTQDALVVTVEYTVDRS